MNHYRLDCWRKERKCKINPEWKASYPFKKKERKKRKETKKKKKKSSLFSWSVTGYSGKFPKNYKDEKGGSKPGVYKSLNNECGNTEKLFWRTVWFNGRMFESSLWGTYGEEGNFFFVNLSFRSCQSEGCIDIGKEKFRLKHIPICKKIKNQEKPKLNCYIFLVQGILIMQVFII